MASRVASSLPLKAGSSRAGVADLASVGVDLQFARQFAHGPPSGHPSDPVSRSISAWIRCKFGYGEGPDALTRSPRADCTLRTSRLVAPSARPPQPS